MSLTNGGDADTVRELAEALFRIEAARPLAPLQLQSSLERRRASETLRSGARNLLLKALRELRTDRERALRYVDAALRLPFDDFEETVAAIAVASDILFGIVVDLLEESDEGDMQWIDGAVTALARLDDSSAGELARALGDIASDYELVPQEERLVRQALSGRAALPSPYRADPQDPTIRDRVIGMLDAAAAYQDATGAQLE